MARLVAIGDSLTQGFQSLAITNTRLSYPALIAERMGLGPQQFRTPNFMGAGGLPCSIEWLARRLEEAYGANLSAFEWIRALHRVPALLDEVEDYWERGRGRQPTANVDYHNLAVWGFEVGDAWGISAKRCADAIRNSKDNFMGIPSEARLRTAYRVLNPSQEPERDGDTQLTIAERIAKNESGIDHLIVALGANNCLGTVVELRVKKTGNTPPGPGTDFTLWTPAAFDQDFAELAARVRRIGAQHTYVATVPHVTIPPITRGVMADRRSLPANRKYYDYYTRFFIRDERFDPNRDPRLTGSEAKQIDETIDQYNATIRRIAGQHGFTVVDICKLLDDLAVRRNKGRTRPLPKPIRDLSVRFFEIHPAGIVREGGLISLDGVHPTTCGYAVMAQLYIDAMRANGEKDVRDIDFAQIRATDSLVSAPPRTLDDIFGALQLLERHFHLSRWLAKR